MWKRVLSAVLERTGGTLAPASAADEALVRRFLHATERLHILVRGRDDEDIVTWAATDRRVLMVERELLEAPEIRSVAHEWVEWVEERRDAAHTTILLHTWRRRYRLDGVDPVAAREFVARVADEADARRAQHGAPLAQGSTVAHTAAGSAGPVAGMDRSWGA
jgi:hypothetical protein